jgi:uncharacterized protein (TIGR03435 family)
MRTLIAIAIVAASVQVALSQTGPVFTVVSIKPNPDPPNISQTHQITPGHIHFVHVGLYQLILDAFQIKDYQLVAPDRLPNGSWDIEATMPVDSSPEQIAAMTRTMLEDRFSLHAHVEKRSIPVYVLTSVERNKLTPTTDPSGRMSIGGTGNGSPAALLRGRGDMSGLASMLTHLQIIGRPVLDRTGLDGRYQIDDTYFSLTDDIAFPSIFTVLKDKLGLKLEPRNEEFDCVAVDHVNAAATPNQ